MRLVSLILQPRKSGSARRNGLLKVSEPEEAGLGCEAKASQSQRSVWFPNPYSFQRTKVIQLKQMPSSTLHFVKTPEKPTKEAGETETEVTLQHFEPRSLYPVLPQSSCIFTSCPRRAGNLRRSARLTAGHSSYTLNSKRASRREDGSRVREDMMGPRTGVVRGAGSTSHNEIPSLEVSV